MSFPVVALVGRPNVGKSSLLNRLAGYRVSIVEPTPGVTRDRVSVIVEHGDRNILFIDTGGMGLLGDEVLKDEIERQIRNALLEADLLLFVVDAREGLTPLDEEVAGRLRKEGKNILLVANKVESNAAKAEAPSFAKLGFGPPFPVSALEGFGISELLDRIGSRLPPVGAERGSMDPLMKIAIVGKRNAGKSSLVNFLSGSERVIVSEIPGTTRDAVDVLFEMEGRRMLAIDTAGLRKKRSIEDAIEFFSISRARRAIVRADVALLLIDVTQPVSRVEKSLGRFLVESHKPVVICMSKWDLARERTAPEEWEEYIRERLPGLSRAPLSFISVKEGFHVKETIDLCFDLFQQSRVRVRTWKINEILRQAVGMVSPKPRRGKVPPKIYYGTQADVSPPTIVLFVNDPSLFTKEYLRFLENRFRENLPFNEVPIKMVLRAREKVELPPLREGKRRKRR